MAPSPDHDVEKLGESEKADIASVENVSADVDLYSLHEKEAGRLIVDPQ